MASSTLEQLATAPEDYKSNVFKYRRDKNAVYPFANTPSGSDWKRPHIQWLGIDLIQNSTKDDILTKKSRLVPSGVVSLYLEKHFNLPWEKVDGRSHSSSSLYTRLFTLTSRKDPLPKYELPDVPQSSSPAKSQASDDIAQGAPGIGAIPGITSTPAHSTVNLPKSESMERQSRHVKQQPRSYRETSSEELSSSSDDPFFNEDQGPQQGTANP